MTIQLKPSLHHFTPNHFGGLGDFLSVADDCERDTLMIASAEHGMAPGNVSLAGTDRFFTLQHISESVPPPEDRERNDLFESIDVRFSNYNLRHVIVGEHLVAVSFATG